MASVVDKQLSEGSKAYLVRFRTADGKQRSKQFKRRRDARAFANVTEVDRRHGTLVDPRLGRITVGEWWDQWWPTVTNLRPSTKARDEQFFRTHARPVFGSTPLGKLDRTALRAWVADLGSPDGSNLAPATIHRVVQLENKCVNAAFENRLWVAEGANPKHVAAMAGHTSVSVVLDRYGHLYPQQDDELMQRLASRAGVPHAGLGG